MIINLWLGVRDDAQAIIKTRVKWDKETQGEYTGPVIDRQNKLFSKMHDLDVTQKLFRVDTVDGRDWTIWSIYFNESVDVMGKIQDELDALMILYPNHIKILGVWHKDGTRVTAYPLHPRLIEFCPDIQIPSVTPEEPPTYRRPVDLAEGLRASNKLLGHGDRQI